MKLELSVIALHSLPLVIRTAAGNLADSDVVQRKAQIQLPQVKSPENNQDPECISGSMKDSC